MLVTLLGIVTDARLLHPLKELSPIVVTFSGIEMEVFEAEASEKILGDRLLPSLHHTLHPKRKTLTLWPASFDF